MSDHPEHHALYLFMFECRSEQMKLCAVQTERAAGENCINGLITASREGNRHNMSESSSGSSSALFVFVPIRPENNLATGEHVSVRAHVPPYAPGCRRPMASLSQREYQK